MLISVNDWYVCWGIAACIVWTDAHCILVCVKVLECLYVWLVKWSFITIKMKSFSMRDGISYILIKPWTCLVWTHDSGKCYCSAIWHKFIFADKGKYLHMVLLHIKNELIYVFGDLVSHNYVFFLFRKLRKKKEGSVFFCYCQTYWFYKNKNKINKWTSD